MLVAALLLLLDLLDFLKGLLPHFFLALLLLQSVLVLLLFQPSVFVLLLCLFLAPQLLLHFAFVLVKSGHILPHLRGLAVLLRPIVVVGGCRVFLAVAQLRCQGFVSSRYGRLRL